ncbi:hypothetical protein [Clostridium sp. NJ4]|nr:hypothetical protein [Clostridium sp. NJ4]
MDISIYKFKNIKLKTNEEYQDYINKEGCSKEEELCYWRKHYWINDWFKKNAKFSFRDEFLLIKEDIYNFYNFCNELLNKGYEKYNINKDDFYCMRNGDVIENIDLIQKEIKKTIEQIKPLLEFDIQNNTLVYDMSC